MTLIEGLKRGACFSGYILTRQFWIRCNIESYFPNMLCSRELQQSSLLVTNATEI